MRICKTTYIEIMSFCSAYHIETGGIIGGESGIIKEFVFDAGMDNKEFGSYSPDAAFLNHCLTGWQKKGIAFYGIVHSHFQECGELSSDDKEYIKSIMLSMPPEITHLYFPIVFPLKEKIVPFIAEKIGTTVKITRDEINII